MIINNGIPTYPDIICNGAWISLSFGNALRMEIYTTEKAKPGRSRGYGDCAGLLSSYTPGSHINVSHQVVYKIVFIFSAVYGGGAQPF